MRSLALILSLCPALAWACTDPVCVVAPDTLDLPREITFDGTPGGYGPGFLVNDVLRLDGAQFAERFVGQRIERRGDHDAVTGAAFGPLTLIPGAAGQNLSVVAFRGIRVLNGYGAEGYPKRRAQGEGAIAILFDDDQYALTLDIRGGEAGAARILFLARSGAVIADLSVAPVGEEAIGFLRAGGVDDIAGIVLTNTDPQGIALDTITFGKPLDLS
ncbi:hypothetical protein KDD17_03665 [Sulfitobacter albidus]|uniref:Phytase-like domain-containing protein n=1 Tax=Sulfitobacter albidus TaxID=2829501 RepID=A0A975PNB9_9RHOB|nr:hypothetical protein [Sulfitobacter albidus]QUJ77135.1 hypothetical protein KDD17_03665 [Sulfitobacter albidus]